MALDLLLIPECKSNAIKNRFYLSRISKNNLIFKLAKVFNFLSKITK